MKKLVSMLLALAMVLTLAGSAMAETKDYSGYTIRIYSNSNSTERTTPLTIGDHVSDARRIFIGTPQITA